MPIPIEESPAPYPLALMLCDQVYVCRTTGKRSLLGCFSVVSAREFPCVHPGMAVYVALTGCRGKVKLKLRLVDADEVQDPLFIAEQESTFEAPDPLAVIEFSMPIPPLEFPTPGEYRMQLLFGGEFFLERRLLVIPSSDFSGDVK